MANIRGVRYRGLIALVGALIVIMMIGCRPESTPAVPATATVAPQWVEIARWSGRGMKQTETFTVPREWRISWATRPGPDDMFGGNFGITIYRADGSWVDMVANVINADEDSSVMRGAGDYYLSFLATQPYVVIVEGRR